MRLDLRSGGYERVIIPQQAAVKSRIYSTGFMIGHYLFAIGGLGMNGECLDDII